MIKFLQRETTEAIRLYFDSTAEKLSKRELEVRAKRNGKLDLGFHFILRKNGELEKGIDEKNYADYELDGYKTSIYVLVTADKLTDSAKFTLNTLADKLKLAVI